MELKQPIPNFLNSFLARPASSIPKGAQWAIAFDNLDISSASGAGGGSTMNLLKAIEKAYEYEPQSKLWNTSKAAEILLNSDYQSRHGCLFAQAIELPGEKIQTNVEGSIKANGFIRARVGGGREDFSTLKITFLETNISFVDSLLRGWALATANFGMIARAPSDPLQYRTTLYCYKFGTHSSSEPPYVLQQVVFDGICCISVSSEEYNYAPVSGTAKMREAEFLYNSYAVDTSTLINTELVDNKIPESQALFSSPAIFTPPPVEVPVIDRNPFERTNPASTALS